MSYVFTNSLMNLWMNSIQNQMLTFLSLNRKKNMSFNKIFTCLVKIFNCNYLLFSSKIMLIKYLSYLM